MSAKLLEVLYTPREPGRWAVQAQQEEAGRSKKAEHNRLVLEAAERQQQLANAKCAPAHSKHMLVGNLRGKA